MKRIVSVGILLLLGLFLTGTFGHSSELQHFEGLEGRIDIAGGTAHIPVMNEAAKRIMTAYPRIQISVAGSGTGIGVQKAGEGLVDIGNTGRPLPAEEMAKFGLKSFPFAIDGVAPIVHPANPVSSLTAQQIRDIFAGSITRWNEVGGPDAAINVFGREEASGTHEVFRGKLLQKEPIVITANIVQSNGAMKVAVARDRHGIGYMSIGHSVFAGGLILFLIMGAINLLIRRLESHEHG